MVLYERRSSTIGMRSALPSPRSRIVPQVRFNCIVRRVVAPASKVVSGSQCSAQNFGDKSEISCGLNSASRLSENGALEKSWKRVLTIFSSKGCCSAIAQQSAFFVIQVLDGDVIAIKERFVRKNR